jgi:K+-transporting ATPase A subunit
VTLNAVLQLALLLTLLLVVAFPLGGYMARVYAGEARFANRVLGGVLLPFPCIKLIDLALSAMGVS